MANKKALLEAALFMTTKPLSTKELSGILECNEKEVEKLINNIEDELSSEEHGIFVFRAKDGFQFRIKPEYISSVRHLTPYQDMNKGLLRVLALVAYKQPITQSEIVKVIGNRTYEYVRTLVGKGLIKTVKQGRTKALVPTREFAEYFGLENPEDAKKLFEKIEENK